MGDEEGVGRRGKGKREEEALWVLVYDTYYKKKKKEAPGPFRPFSGGRTSKKNPGRGKKSCKSKRYHSCGLNF